MSRHKKRNNFKCPSASREDEDDVDHVEDDYYSWLNFSTPAGNDSILESVLENISPSTAHPVTKAISTVGTSVIDGEDEVNGIRRQRSERR